MVRSLIRARYAWLRARCAGALHTAFAITLGALPPATLQAATALADQPVFSVTGVPGNLVLALSVEYPTAVSAAYRGSGSPDVTFNPAVVYLGYFDPKKCYVYVHHAIEAERHFSPSGVTIGATGTSPGACTGSQDTKWSGSFLNWATMQTVDPFRWALTGGYRSIDDATRTVLEKANASGQGGDGNFPYKHLTSSAAIAGATPFGWTVLKMRVHGLGNKLRFTSSGNITGAGFSNYDGSTGPAADTVWELSARVRVCVDDVSTGPMEANCTAYPGGTYKPTGLIQKYADKIKYSTFGYLNDSNILRDGGVLRARQKFVGPTYQLPTLPVTANAASEWSAVTGIFNKNPDSGDASATSGTFGVTVEDSGVINYLNKFGQLGGTGYKTYDNVGELYYAALRYLKNQGNVPEWTAMGSASPATKAGWIDGFPVITSWDDPIKYSCQRNFVLGIGDVNTHADKGVPGATSTANEPARPAAISADTTVNAVTATHKVGALHGLGSTLGTTYPFNGCCSNNSALIAGLAYDANTRDIRPDIADVPGRQTVQTYWVDVLEFGAYKANNQYYLAAKYGGFKVPAGFDPYARTTDIDEAWWRTSADIIFGQKRPDNYFTAAKADDMVSGLRRAFSSIASSLRPYTTSFATALPQIATAGVASYSALYDASNWTGDLTAATTDFSTTGTPTSTVVWSFGANLAAQATGTGWSTKRRIVTWQPDPGKSTGTPFGDGAPFRHAKLTSAQRGALDTAYRIGDDSAAYVDYLRGDASNEDGVDTASSDGAYRRRDSLLGDIVNAKPRVVGAPLMPFSDATNPGYGAFRSLHATRPTTVYVASNSGMVHAVDGAITGTTGGRELFAYVPNALYTGNTGSPPKPTGLASRGDPEFEHLYLVDSSPTSFDVDFSRTGGASGSPDWRTLVVGGLGKGGKAYYALDATNPAGIDTVASATTSETAVATRVLWEFTDADLGYTYGQPLAVKTRQHGWVLLFGSGYNTASGRGHLYVVNPKTGRLIQKIEAITTAGAGGGSLADEAGLAHVQAYVLDRTDGTVDAAYAGDLLGNVWRFDLSAATGAYPKPALLAQLRDASGNPQPVTSRPLVVVQPVTNTRWVAVGTGRLLASSDVGSTAPQTMYAVKDGTGLAFAATPPAGFTYPVLRDKMRALTDLTRPVVLDAATENGWYIDLGTGGGGLGWRVLSDPSSFYGILEFSAMVPNGEVCSPSGVSRIYAVELGSGRSNLLQADGVTSLAYSDALGDLATDLGSKSVGGVRQLIGCGSTGGCKPFKTKRPDALTLRRLNWRELPLAN